MNIRYKYVIQNEVKNLFYLHRSLKEVSFSEHDVN